MVEDVGETTLAGGRAVVKLDPDFAGLLQGAKYQVFLTPDGDCNGLYATGKSASGFEIRESKAGTSSVGVGYRVLARLPRQAGARLERVTSPPGTSSANGTQQPDDAPKPVEADPAAPTAHAYGTEATRRFRALIGRRAPKTWTKKGPHAGWHQGLLSPSLAEPAPTSELPTASGQNGQSLLTTVLHSSTGQ